MIHLHQAYCQNDLVNHENGIGIQGYDPVAYFTQEEAIKGKENISFTYEGITYYFISDRNRVLFTKEPEKYLPAYGGWCAYAMAGGEKVKIDPETFKVKDGKLYLFYNFYFNNTLTRWNEDEADLKNKADKNWIQLTK